MEVRIPVTAIPQQQYTSYTAACRDFLLNAQAYNLCSATSATKFFRFVSQTFCVVCRGGISVRSWYTVGAALQLRGAAFERRVS